MELPPSNVERIAAMTRSAITHDDRGIDRTPTCRGDWDDWVSASSTRNHVLDDPLLDWLDRHGPAKGFAPNPIDQRTDFLEFVFRKASEFERAVTAHIASLAPGDMRSISRDRSTRAPGRDAALAAETFDAMAAGASIIDQGVLWDAEQRTYGLPDLLVRSDVAARLFPSALTAEQASAPAAELDIGDRHYVAIDIKYTTLHFTAKGHLANTGSAGAYKVQLHIYNAALARLQGYCAPQAFLLGRGWQCTQRGQTTRVGNCMDRLAPVAHNEATPSGALSERAAHAAAWLRRMRRDGHLWDALPEPSVEELRPNAKGDHGHLSNAVKEIVAAGRDLTVLARVGVPARRAANAKGIFDWRDERITPAVVGVNGATTAPQLQALLDVNRTPGPAVRPEHVAAARSVWFDVPPLEFYVDFETVSDLDDDFSELPDRGGQPLVFMVGCGHLEDGQWRFACFTADDLTEPSEAAVIEQWMEHMASVGARLDPDGTPRAIHWSAHEASSLRSAYNAAARRHPERSSAWIEPLWFDFLAEVVRREPVVVRGAHGFGLKPMTNALHAAGLVETRWGAGPTDGLGAMVGAWWCQHQVEQRRLRRLLDLELMQEIRDYNEVDCKAMMEIVRYLRVNH